ncbi:periphilin-1-like [Megalops cyprinoides]|uniref:periphilin-1-like n=1 Tax=Megalops cyprinoides TaxID=118141 RepID=UPI0018656309|nr:periphilin-1-like [Megalops cyprinoides]
MRSSGHKDHGFVAGERKQPEDLCDSPIKCESKAERRPRRSRSPSLIRAPYRPRFGGRFFRPWFKRGERFFQRPSFHYHGSTGVRFHARGSLGALSPPSHATWHSDLKYKKKCSAGTSKHLSDNPQLSKCTSRERELKSLSFLVSQEDTASQTRDIPFSVMRAAQRNQAIQQKRREIEEVYRQDCDTFGIIVKMLIAKDPSLEQPIQSSLQENLREIGLRCVGAMQNFIMEYDSNTQSPSDPPQL